MRWSAAVLAYFVCFWLGAVGLAVTPSPSNLHDFAVRIWRSQDGLPQSRIQAITQTTDGYLWIGTSAGLVRFDGVRFVAFDRFNAPAFRDDSIVSLYPGKNGSLWVGSEGGGLLRYRGGLFESFGLEHGLSDLFVRSVLEDSLGRVWIGTDRGLFSFDGANFHRLDDRPPATDIYVSSIYEDALGRIWAGGSDLVRVEGDRLISYPVSGPSPQNYARTILRIEDGLDPFLVTWRGLQNLHGDRLFDSFEASLIAEAQVRTALEDSQGNLWIGTVANGLIRISDGKAYFYASPQWLPDNSILSLYEDREGNLWVGTIDGLARFSRNLVDTVSSVDGLDDDNVVTVSEDRSGHRWLATGVGGLFQISPQGVIKRFELPVSPDQFAARNVFEDSTGAHWIGSVQSGIVRIDRNGAAIFTSSNGLAHHSVRAIAEDRQGRIWAATGSGLSRWDGSRFKSYQVEDGLAYRSVRCLLVDSRGDLWVGTDGGVNLIRDGEFVAKSALEKVGRERVYSMQEDTKGGVWLGTRGGGLCRIRDERLDCLSSRQGLPSNTIFQILQDADDRFWMSTPNGIFSIDGDNLRSVVDGRSESVAAAAYGSSEGMGSNQMNGGYQPAGSVFSDGKLWFAGVKGAVSVDPGQVPVTDVSPVLVEEVLLDQVPLSSKGTIYIPSTGHRLDIHYTVPNLRSPERVGFRYMLEGFDSTWTAVSSRRVAQYVGLPPGNYRFRLAAVDTFFPQRSAEIALPIVWEAPFYRTSWFLFVCLAVFVGCALLALKRYQTRTQQRYAIRLAERTRVAREMHDTVIQGCVGVSTLLEAASSAMSVGGSSAREYLDHARQQVGLTLDEARKAVWDLRHDPSEQAPAQSLIEFANHLSQEKGVQMDLDVSKSSHQIEGELGRNLLLVGQEALRNAVIHGRPRRVRVRLDIDHESAMLEVTDDGSGFDPDVTDPEATLHYGLLGMKERVEQFGGRIEIISVLGKGSTILAQFPLAGRQRMAQSVPS